MCAQCDRRTRRTRAQGIAILAVLFGTVSAHQVATLPIAGHAVRAPMAACTFEDGSGRIGPDRQQAFPCLWDATRQGNRTGESFILWTDPYSERA